MYRKTPTQESPYIETPFQYNYRPLETPAQVFSY